MSKVFIDTSVLVYTLDNKDELKKENARRILKKIIELHQPVLSTQVIKEFYVVAAAEKAHCEYIFSEGLNPGQTYRGVTVVNPFENEACYKSAAVRSSILTRLSSIIVLINALAENRHGRVKAPVPAHAGTAYEPGVIVFPLRRTARAAPAAC